METLESDGVQNRVQRTGSDGGGRADRGEVTGQRKQTVGICGLGRLSEGGPVKDCLRFLDRVGDCKGVGLCPAPVFDVEGFEGQEGQRSGGRTRASEKPSAKARFLFARKPIVDGLRGPYQFWSGWSGRNLGQVCLAALSEFPRPRGLLEVLRA